jgi:tRNA pseudouridine38-40 synthase
MRAYRIAYDGSAFRGFQRQPDVPTVEDTLFDALTALDVYDLASHRPDGYAAAGRTDAGVSALAQTVAFAAPDWLTPAALNGELPADVRAWASADAPDDFHATHDATAREYTYYLHAPETVVDDDHARTALERLRGEHDFHNLTPDDERTVRELDGDLARDGAFLVVRLEAGGFARHLVRRLVSLLDDVARGERDVASVERVLASESLDGAAGVGSAPAYPLVLTDVCYPDLSFEVDEQAAETVRQVFGDRRAEHATRARVAGHIADGP